MTIHREARRGPKARVRGCQECSGLKAYRFVVVRRRGKVRVCDTCYQRFRRNGHLEYKHAYNYGVFRDPKKLQEAARLRLAGMQWKDLARHFNCHPTTVYYHCDRLWKKQRRAAG